MADDGATILTGTEIKTRDRSASVQIANIGSVDIESDSTATVSFSEGNLNVQVVKGNAGLSAFDGTSGKLISSTGEVIETNETVSTVSTTGNVAKKRGGTTKTWVWFLIAGGAAGAIGYWIYQANKDDNDASRRTP